MADQETKRDSSARVQIIVALIGLAGVIATALISNWSNIFSRKPDQPASRAASSTTPASATPSKKSERPLHSSGRLTIRGTYMCDLDEGKETSQGADFWWEQQAGAVRFLTPKNGAGFFVIGSKDFESVRWSEMERFPYSNAKIEATADSSNRIPVGAVVAYKTNEGRLGKFIIDDYGYNLTIRWRTYD